MPPANTKYDVLKEYKLGYYNDATEELLSDEKDIAIKNKATRDVVDYVNSNITYFITNSDDRQYDEDSDGIDESAFYGEDEEIVTDDPPRVYWNIALKARFSFSESTLVCPCHKSNEYYYQMHYIPQPENWCQSNKSKYKSLKGLVDHLKRYKESCKWHDIYHEFFSSLLKDYQKKNR